MGWLKLCTKNSKVLCRPCLRRVGESALVRSLTGLVDMIKLIYRDLLIHHHQCPSFNASSSRIDPKCGSDPVLSNFLCRSITVSECHVPCGRIIPWGRPSTFFFVKWQFSRNTVPILRYILVVLSAQSSIQAIITILFSGVRSSPEVTQFRPLFLCPPGLWSLLIFSPSSKPCFCAHSRTEVVFCVFVLHWVCPLTLSHFPFCRGKVALYYIATPQILNQFVCQWSYFFGYS